MPNIPIILKSPTFWVRDVWKTPCCHGIPIVASLHVNFPLFLPLYGRTLGRIQHCESVTSEMLCCRGVASLYVSFCPIASLWMHSWPDPTFWVNNMKYTVRYSYCCIIACFLLFFCPLYGCTLCLMKNWSWYPHNLDESFCKRWNKGSSLGQLRCNLFKISLIVEMLSSTRGSLKRRKIPKKHWVDHV